MKKLVYLHIEKTAGTSQRVLFDESFGHERVHWYGRDSVSKRFRADNVNEAFVIGGHRQFDFYSNDQFGYLAVVREPIERVISFFNYCRTQEYEAWSKLKLDPGSLKNTLLNSKAFRRVIRNAQCCYLSGAESFEKTKDNILRNKFAVASLEQVEAFNDYLIRNIDRVEGVLNQNNAGKAGYKKSIDIDNELKQEIRQLVTEDIKLYEFINSDCNGLFDNIKQSDWESFNSAVWKGMLAPETRISKKYSRLKNAFLPKGTTKLMKKFRQIVLHVGSDKAGSTAIQAELNRSRDRLLEEHKIAYAPGIWQAELTSFFANSPPDYVFNKAQGKLDPSYLKKRDKKYFDEFLNWLASLEQCDSLVLSYEGMIGLSEESLLRLKNFCLEHSDNVRVLMYVRPPLSYAVSAMSQRVKTGRYSFLENAPPRCNYKKILEKLIGIFGRENTEVRLFERESLVGNDVVTDFMSFLSVPNYSYESDNANESITNEAKIYGDFLIELLNNFLLPNTLPQYEFSQLFERDLYEIPGEKIALTPEQARIILEYTKGDLAYLEDMFSISINEPIDKYVEGIGKNESELLKSILHSFAKITAVNYVNSLQIKSAKGTIKVERDSFKIKKGESLNIPVTLNNNANCDWVSTKKSPVRLAYRIYDEEDKPVSYVPKRSNLPIRIKAGEAYKVNMSIDLPAHKGGRFSVELMPLQEGNCWFDGIGFVPPRINIEVEHD